LYFHSDRIGGYGQWDLWVTTRASVNDEWGAPVNLGPTINAPASDSCPGISPDGLLLFFSSDRPGGSGDFDMYVARRATKRDPWGPPMNLGPIVNGTSGEFSPRVSFDGSMFYFNSNRPGGYAPSYTLDTWQAPIIPVADFNGDGKVDEKDLSVMAQHWGENYPRCDVGPFAWGDGIVDAQDWVVLVEAIGGSGFILNPKPHAVEVPRNMILSWTSAPFSQSYDIYFGTSEEAVSSASRANPQNVLVSQGQTATTYHPADLLAYGRTYYWRIDFVTPGPSPTIYQGPVLSFTTEAYPIRNVTAKASSSQAGMDPQKTVDGSGLGTNDGHSTASVDMWRSDVAGPQPTWIQFEFDKVYALQEMWVWNHNVEYERVLGYGFKDVTVEHSLDGTTWTALGNVQFAQATALNGYAQNTTVNLGGVTAQYVKLTAKNNWSPVGLKQCGLSEVRFFYIPATSAAKP
jgi:hypothetical protein